LLQTKAQTVFFKGVKIPKARQIALTKAKEVTKLKEQKWLTRKIKPTKEGAKRLAQLKQPIKVPKIKIIQTQKPKKTFKQIKFKEPKIPKGFIPKPTKTGMIVLQKVKQIKKTKPKLKLVEKPIPQEWKGVYDVQVPSQTFGIQKQVFREAELKTPLLTLTRFDGTKETRIPYFAISEREREKVKTFEKIKFEQEKIQEFTQKFKEKQRYDTIQKQKIKQQVQKYKFGQLPMFDWGYKYGEITRTKTPQVPKFPRVPQVPKIPIPIPASETKPISKGQNILVKGFDVYVKREGKWIKISRKSLTRTQALKLGAQRVRRTLAASFKIVESPRKTTKKTKGFFKPSPTVFRSYKIVKGRKVPLANTYIQKASKRLSTRGEVKEIQTFKKKKVKWM